MRDPLNEANDEFADPVEVFVDAGTKAIVAGVSGNEREWKRQIERGRKARLRIAMTTHDERIEQVFTQVEEMRRKRRHKRKAKPSTPLTSSLGDALRAAGVVSKEDRDGN